MHVARTHTDIQTLALKKKKERQKIDQSPLPRGKKPCKVGLILFSLLFPQRILFGYNKSWLSQWSLIISVLPALGEV